MNSIKLAATIVLSFALVFLLFDGGDPSIEGETRAEVPEVSSEGVEQALVQPDGDPEDRTMAGEASSGASSSESGDQIAVISGRVLPPLEGAPRLDRVVVVGWRRNPDGPGREHFETRCDALGNFEFPPGPTRSTWTLAEVGSRRSGPGEWAPPEARKRENQSSSNASGRTDAGCS